MVRGVYEDISLSETAKRIASTGLDASVKGSPEVRMQSKKTELFSLGGVSSILHATSNATSALFSLLILTRIVPWSEASDTGLYILVMMLLNLVTVLFAIVGRVRATSTGVNYHFEYYYHSYLPIFWAVVSFVLQAAALSAMHDSHTTKGMVISFFNGIFVVYTIGVLFFATFTLPSLVKPAKHVSPHGYYAAKVGKYASNAHAL